MKKEKGFYFSAIFWQANRKLFLEVTQIEDALVESIELSKFGEGIQKIIFVPMGVPENDPIHQEKVKFTSRSKKLEIYKRLPIEDFSTLSLEAFLQQTAQLFYTVILKELKKRKIKDFDVLSFTKAIEQLFLKKGWLVPQEMA